jgi:hypothetical protein
VATQLDQQTGGYESRAITSISAMYRNFAAGAYNLLQARAGAAPEALELSVW